MVMFFKFPIPPRNKYAGLVNLLDHNAGLVNLFNHYAGLLKLLDHCTGLVKLLERNMCLVKHLEHHMEPVWKSSPVIWKERGNTFVNVGFLYIT